MKVAVSALDGGKKKLTVEVAASETQPFLDRALDRLAAKHQIPGFRPGHAPRALLRSRFGEMAVLEEALQELVSKTLFDALREHSIDSLGEPEVAVEKMAPGNAVVYAATVSVMPSVTLGDWRKVSVAKKAVEVTDADVEKLVDELRDLSATEALVLRPAKSGDRIEINFAIKENGVIIEGGSGNKFPVVLGKGSLVPGFEDALLGMAAGEKKQFSLTFPMPYFQERLAGKTVSVSAECINVYERSVSELSDAWAQKMMNKDLADIRSSLESNIRQEREKEERMRVEHSIIEGVIGGASFGVIPDSLVEHEIEKMIAELESDVVGRGMQWEKYLESIKRTVEQLHIDFKEQALKRTQAALVMRELAKDLDVSVSDTEVKDEWERHKDQYQNNPEAREAVDRNEYRMYLARVLTNRKTLDAVVELVGK